MVEVIVGFVNVLLVFISPMLMVDGCCVVVHGVGGDWRAVVLINLCVTDHLFDPFRCIHFPSYLSVLFSCTVLLSVSFFIGFFPRR